MVKSVPPFFISGSAKWAMRMKVQQNTSIVARKSSRDDINNPSLKRILRRKGNGVNDEVEFAPVLSDPFKNSLHLAWRIDIEWHHDRGFERTGERLDIFFRFLIKIGHCDLSPERPE